MPPSASPRKASQKSDTAAPRKKPAAPAGGDLRNYFGGNAPVRKETAATSSSGKGTNADPVTIDGSSDEEMVVKKPTARYANDVDSTDSSKPPPPKARPTTSKHFAAPARAPVKLESSPEPEPIKPAPKVEPKAEPKATAPKASSSKSKSVSVSPAKRKSSVKPADSESEEERPAKRAAAGKAKRLVDSDDSEDDFKPVKKPAAKPASKGRKRSVISSDSESEEDEVLPKPKARAAPKTAAKKAPAAKKAKADDKADGALKEETKKKFNFAAALAAKQAGPRAPGSKEIPIGKPGCLAGLTFVFTGELESLGRDDAQDLAKRYMAKVTAGPSGKTSYVVLGENAGPSKLAKIKAHNIKTLTEDEFLNLIATREGELDEKQQAALEKEEKKILEQAKELEKRQQEEEREAKKAAVKNAKAGIATKKVTPASAQLWTTKYAPQSIKEVCGNKGQIDKLLEWLQNWQKNYKFNFKKPGKTGTGLYRAVLISGPPGIGKTTSAHLMAKEAGYSPLELNASDARSKKLVENSTNIDNTSLDGFFGGQGMQSTTVTGASITSRTCLIMDEVDGMSAGDRGGVGALNALIKKTKIPIILICNDKNLPKMKPLWSTTADLAFRRPRANEIRSRIMTILHREKLKIPPPVVDELVQGTNSDIRQVLNMLSTYKLGKSEMSFEDGKELIKVNEKNTIMTPFTITDKLTGPYAFARTNKQTLGDKMELFFHDISFVPLFIQEHYLKTEPAACGNLAGPELQLKNLELLSKAADAVSDGDLVDRMIHGTEQHWSLLPFHAVTSAILPASYIYGKSRPTPGGGWGGPAFPQWLGQNSKQTKLARQLTDIQIRMRLSVSGGRDEIRQQYMPLLASKIVVPLEEMKGGADAIPDVISVMDDYYLGKDDWDAFVELGVDTRKDELVLKQIASATKSAFTRQYNKTDHPIAFHKGDMFAASKRKIADVGPAPDNDDVFEDDEPVGAGAGADDEDEGKDDEDVNAVGKDKLIKEVKPKGKAKAKKK